MKYITNIFNFLLPTLIIFYTAYQVNTGDICRTIFGCTMLLMCYWNILQQTYNNYPPLTLSFPLEKSQIDTAYPYYPIMASTAIQSPNLH